MDRENHRDDIFEVLRRGNILLSVGSDEEEVFLVVCQGCREYLPSSLRDLDVLKDRINDGIAGHVDSFIRDPLTKKELPCGRCRSEQII